MSSRVRIRLRPLTPTPISKASGTGDSTLGFAVPLLGVFQYDKNAVCLTSFFRSRYSAMSKQVIFRGEMLSKPKQTNAAFNIHCNTRDTLAPACVSLLTQRPAPAGVTASFRLLSLSFPWHSLQAVSVTAAFRSRRSRHSDMPPA